MTISMFVVEYLQFVMEQKLLLIRFAVSSFSYINNSLEHYFSFRDKPYKTTGSTVKKRYFTRQSRSRFFVEAVFGLW